MEYKTILFEKEENVGKLYLNRPEKLNAYTDEMRAELIDFFNTAATDDDLRVLIVSGKGRAFCAGFDLNIFKERYRTYLAEGQQDGSFRKLLPQAVFAFPRPIIAAINGLAMGLGSTLPLACDIRIASTEATFSFAFSRIGATPEFCSSYFLPRLIGSGMAAELIFTARRFDAQEAMTIGLINRVVPPEDLMPEAEKMAAQIAHFPPMAVASAKNLLRHGSQSTIDQVLDYETVVLQQMLQHPEHYKAICRVLEEIQSKKKQT